MKLSGWGRFPVTECRTGWARGEDEIRSRLTGGPLIARGNGRAYGDSALGTDLTLMMGRMDRMLSFDADTGLLVAEAGVVLRDVIAAFLPRGWFPMVTPGTKFVTLGGMAAADVHGKNHHGEGSFRSCVVWIDLLTADGRVLRCSADDQAELFDRTLGGMGLTGVILRLALRLRPVESGWIVQRTQAAPDLRSALEGFEAGQDATYSVAWIDCLAAGPSLGRSLLMLGEHAPRADLPRSRQRHPYDTPAKRRLRVPFDAPRLALNRATVGAFNALYYARGSRRAGPDLVDWDSYFYPLDAILGWNRIYGRRGFVQFQCVLPLAASEAGLTALLTATSAAGLGSFLAVLKRMGPQESALSFPMEGYTLALDFPASAGALRLLDRLDAITLDHGGRFYLAKDARMSVETLKRSDPRVAAFRAARTGQTETGQTETGQAERASFISLQSRRLDL